MADQSAGAAAGGTPTPPDTPPDTPPGTPPGTLIEELISRIREALGSLTPEPLLNRLTPVVEEFLSQFQLVPHRDFQTHLKTLAELEATVSQLEERIRSLEQAEHEHHS